MKKAVVSKKQKQTKIKTNNIKINQKFAKKNYRDLISDLFSDKKSKGDRDRSSYRKTFRIEPIKNENQLMIPRGVKKSVVDVVKYTQSKFKMPLDCICDVIVDLSMRCARTNYPPPNPRTVMRVIMNYNNNDLYKLTSTLPVGKDPTINLGMNTRDVYMRIDEMTGLGPYGLCSYNIMVNGNPRFKIPTDNGEERNTIKPRNYARITVILDFYISKMFAKDLEKHLSSFNENSNNDSKYMKIIKTVLMKMIEEYIKPELDLEREIIEKSINDL
uniref:Uncharacterized protein n=1 Tax=Pithovirus LCPAC001 TaxID=2506585 RepID=A0A481Z1E0_9VIRU|nr:MAG: hypothetical protein LCPAC001_00470 [Pithovirus LCPAC001]